MSSALMLTVADHTAAVRYCLERGLILSEGAHNQRTVRRRAADLADGRMRDVLSVDEPQTWGAASVEDLRIALATAQSLLDDGARTIYRPGYWHEEGMLRVSEAAVAELALAATTAAIRAAGSVGDAEQNAIRAAIAASVPVAVRLTATVRRGS